MASFTTSPLPLQLPHGRVTMRRQIGYYGNCRASDTLRIEVDAFALGADQVLLDHRVHRDSGGGA